MRSLNVELSREINHVVLGKSRKESECGGKPKVLLLGDNGGHSSQRTGMKRGKVAGTVF